MRLPARSTTALLALSLLLSSCAGSHGRGDDAGPGDGGREGCGSSSFLICVSDCGSDAGLPPICTGGEWACPPGTRDIYTCPPTCHGPPPPGCVCMGTEWVCDDMVCPPGIDPWSPDSPGNACSIEGAHCTSGGPDACGSAMFCDCRDGRWSCAVAEPDPVCWCGRAPTEGDRCAEEGASCGECCPTAGGTGWPLMFCVDGHWAPGDCPAIVCPPVEAICPADAPSAVGTPCFEPTATCGDPCCGTAIVCDGGVWRPGPEAACPCGGGFACGSGTCRDDQLCRTGCGPDDGIEHTCRSLPSGCHDCTCIPLWGTETCEMIDGHPHVREPLFCG